MTVQHWIWLVASLWPLAIGPSWDVGGSSALAEVPEWVVYPDKQWQRITPTEAGLDAAKWNAWVAQQRPAGNDSWGQNPERRFGVVVTRGGYLLKTFGDADFKVNSASVGKAFTSFALQLAIDEGLITDPKDPIRKYWTGAGQMDAERKRLDRGHHESLTFSHLHAMRGGFPISNGWFWSKKQSVPSWAKWTGDPTADNYAHAQPGKQWRYSSGGRWRLSQALTAVWERELKDVLDAELFGHMGIKPDDWQWATGEELHDNRNWYPGMPGYGLFCDLPYKINDCRVQGGGGWVVMSASDLARVGLLVASRGIWKGKRLIGDTALVRGHAGGNSSLMQGWSDTMIAWGQVTTRGVSTRGLKETVIRPLALPSGAQIKSRSAKAPTASQKSWQTKTPREMKMDANKLNEFAKAVGGDGVVIRGGYLVKTWGKPDRRADWASSCKPVISTLLLFAVHEGKLESVDDPIRPWVRQRWPGKDLIEKDRTMTFRHLANMTSGYFRAEAPGTHWAYNDYAIQLYAELLTEVLGTSLNDAALARFKPLGLQDGDLFGSRGGAGVSTSPRDFARIGWFWLNRGRWKGKQLLPRELLTRHCRPDVPGHLPRSKKAGSDYLQIGTHGGGTDQDFPGQGIYGFNWWFNAKMAGGNQKFLPQLPDDAFCTIGHRGLEVMLIVPSWKLVVAARGKWGGVRLEKTKLLADAIVTNDSSR